MLLVVVFFIFVFVIVPLSLYGLSWLIGKLFSKRFAPAEKIGKITGFVLTGALLSIYVFGFAIGWKIVKMREVEIPFKDLPEAFDGYRIAQISDLHLGTYSKHKETIETEVLKILHKDVDLIVFTGDIVNVKPSEIEPFKNILSALNAPDGVWSIMGNHDYCTYGTNHDPEFLASQVAELQSLERKMGWNVMLNSNTIIRRGADSLALIGVENDGRPPFPQFADMDKAMEGLSDGAFKIILSHDPTHWHRTILPDTDINLMLAGHTHAMQFKIGPYSPSRFMFKEWGGLYREGEQVLYVSTGSGGNIPFRFGAWPEVEIFTLRRQN